jgi:hypothetical protein
MEESVDIWNVWRRSEWSRIVAQSFRENTPVGCSRKKAPKLKEKLKQGRLA